VVTPGAHIRRRRQLARLTRAVLADKVGVTERTVSYWEADIHKPRLVHAWRLADVLGGRCSTYMK
jgi:transcriptional regulator with XRE-family HTH domain